MNILLYLTFLATHLSSWHIASLFSHLQSENVEFMQFAFRWMNCLLMREISVKNTIRMWDTYLVRYPLFLELVSSLCSPLNVQAEGPDAFSQFHLYVCSAFLINWSKKLQEMDFQVCLFCLKRPDTSQKWHCLTLIFQGIIMFLQSLPTQSWGDHEIELLLSHAFVLNATWQNAQSHFLGS